MSPALSAGTTPAITSHKAKRSTYQQHRRYLIEKEKDLTCPRKQFHDDLVQQLKQWRKQWGPVDSMHGFKQAQIKDFLSAPLTHLGFG